MDSQRAVKTTGLARPALLDRLAGGRGSESEGGIVLIRYDDAGSSADFVDSLLHAIPPSRPVARARGASLHSGPYQPFLGWMRSRAAALDDQSLSRLMESSSVYRPQRRLLFHALRGEPPRRREEILPDELAYERAEMLKSLESLFRALFDADRGVFIVEDAQELRPSALALLSTFARSAEGGGLLILSSDRKGPLRAERMGQCWENALDAVEGKAYLVDLGTRHPRVGSETEGEEVIREGRSPSLDEIEESLALLSWEDAALLLERREREGSGPATEEGGDQVARTEFLRGEIAFHQGYHDSALVHFQAIAGLAQASRSPALLELSCRRAAYSHFARNNIDRALSFTAQARGLAEAMGDEARLLHCLTLALSVDDKENRMEAPQWREAYERVLSLARQLRMPNTLAFWLARPDRLDPAVEAKLIESNIARSIAIARKLGNANRLSMAYHAMGLFHIFLNRYDKVERYYRMSERMTRRLGNAVHLAQIRNGFGYFAHQNGRYALAEEYFRKALRSARDASDHHEVCMALCNLGTNALVCGHFARAASFMEALLRVMRILGIRELPYHSMTGINALLALCRWGSGRISRFLETYAAGERIPRLRHANTRAQNYAEEVLLDHLVQACYRAYHRDERAAEGLLEAGSAFLESNRPMVGYRAPFYFLEGSRVLSSLGAEEKAKEWISACRAEAQRQGNEDYLSFLSAEGGVPEPGATIALPDGGLPPFDRICRQASNSKALNQLHRRIEELDFLNNFQNAMGNSQNQEALAQRCMGSILAAFPLDIVSFSLREPGETAAHSPLFERFPPGMDKGTLDSLRPYIASLGDRPSFLRKVDESSDEAGPGMSSLISLTPSSGPGPSCHLFFATCGEGGGLKEEDFSVLSLAGKQLAAALERIGQAIEIREKNRLLEEKNALLFHRATRDILTGLHNRQYILQRLEEVEASFRRKQSGDLSLLYLDLDNFKLYNDAYGHPVGDAILVAACSILRAAVRDSDILGRFGGDEFVILLPDTPISRAEAVASRVLEGFADQDWIKDIVREATGEEASFPPDRALSCSIGIGHRDGPFRKEELIRDADLALYRAKKEGKRRWRIHAE